MSVNAGEFRAALGRWVSGVSVVTCGWRGQLQGMTVSAFSSVSLAPPLISVCLATGARTLALIRNAECFAVNLLSEEQAQLSGGFASRAEDAERFDGVDYTLSAEGVPLLAGVTAQIVCKASSFHELGDHVLVVGEVLATYVFDRQPLVYYSAGYGRFESQ
ncbi:MAG: hypothetical protein RJA70_3501 [Pseudomonadota bacterium]|jgi:flavin reductase (DIM6/NTAB) family NADH-FMN oxidoreductase RutF